MVTVSKLQTNKEERETDAKIAALLAKWEEQEVCYYSVHELVHSHVGGGIKLHYMTLINIMIIFLDHVSMYSAPKHTTGGFIRNGVL